MSNDMFDQDQPDTDQLPAVIEPRRGAVMLHSPADHTERVSRLIEVAIQNKLDPDALEKLVALQERAMAREAKAAFDQAKREFQAECPVIGKNRGVDGGERGPKYRFADLEKITTTIRPLLERFGFSYDFTQKYDKEIIEVTCHLHHAGGHTQATPFSAPWATNAGMSAAQKSASATTFCQRYALRMALGLPVGEDDDARQPPAEHDNPDRDETKPNVKPRGERQQQPKPDVTPEMMRRLCEDWRELIGDGKFSAPHFVGWAVKQNPDAPPVLDPDKPASWPAAMTRAQYDLCMGAMP